MKEITKPYQYKVHGDAKDFGAMSKEDVIAFKKEMLAAQNAESDKKKIEKCFGPGPQLVDGEKVLKGDKWHKVEKE